MSTNIIYGTSDGERMEDNVAHTFMISIYRFSGGFSPTSPHVTAAAGRGETRYRSWPSPMQMFTHPSAPDMQAPNQANSASGGVITP